MRPFPLLSASLPLAIAASLTALTAAAGAAEPRLEAGAELGVAYDSEVSVDELDIAVGRGDFALTPGANVGVVWDATERLTLNAGYFFDGRFYEENADFNLQLHRIAVGGKVDTGIADLGFSHNHVIALLGGDEFLNYDQTTADVGKLFRDRIYVRVAGDYRQKNFPGRPDRDATGFEGGAQLFNFFNEARSFVLVGASGVTEDAEADRFDYGAVKGQAKISHKFDAVGRENQAQFRYGFEDRDYDAITPSIGEVRNDTRHLVGAALNTALNDRFSVLSDYSYTDNSSNLETFEYTEHLVSVGLRVEM